MIEPLASERLMIRNFRPEDALALHDYLSRADVLVHEPDDPRSLAECEGLASERAQGDHFLAVCLRGDGRMIGHLYVARQEPDAFDTWEIGYIFNPAFGKRGYATEAARRLLDWLFTEKAAHRVMAMCSPENPNSWRLLERLGMRREGHFRQKAFFRRDPLGHPVWHDAYEYAILSSEWPADGAVRHNG